MAGHSKFKNIMHRKGRADAARSEAGVGLTIDVGRIAVDDRDEQVFLVMAGLGFEVAGTERLPGSFGTRPQSSAR